MKSYITLSAPNKRDEDKAPEFFCVMVNNIVSFIPLEQREKQVARTRVKCIDGGYDVIETVDQICAKIDAAAE